MHIIKKVDAEMRKKLEPFFSNAHRVDFGIDSILEGQSGKQISVVVDNPESPGVVLLRYGTFGILAGDAFFGFKWLVRCCNETTDYLLNICFCSPAANHRPVKNPLENC